MASTFTTVVNKSGNSGHSCLVSDLGEKAFKLSPFSIMLAIILCYVGFIVLTYSPSIPNLLRVFLS